MQEKFFRYEKYTGSSVDVVLPAYVDDKPLAIIGEKSFLSCRDVEKLTLPDTVEVVENWAFAHMKGLTEISFPSREISFGKKVFLGCSQLKKVGLGGAVDLYAGIPYFLASMFLYFPQDRLLHLEQAGDRIGQWDWLVKYDEELAAYLRKADDYDFVPAFIGWFDVEDVDDQKDSFVTEQRKNKIHLVFQRLLYRKGLSQKHQQEFADFLMETPEILFDLFCDAQYEYGKNIAYYKIWAEIGGLQRVVITELLNRLQEAEPEVVRFLVNAQWEQNAQADFFAGLEL